MIKNLPVVLAEVGKIKIGKKGQEITTKKGNKMRLPVKLNHFIITKTERGPDGNFVIDEVMTKIYGDKPTEIKILLPFNSIDANFTTSLKSYKGKSLYCTGNNEVAQRLQEDGTRKEIKCDFNTCPIAVGKRCKTTGTLSVILPDNPELGGVYKFRTTSWHGVVKTLSSLKFLQSITKNLTGVRLTMKLLSGVADVNGAATNYKYVTVVYKGEDVMMLVESNKINQLRHDQTEISKKLEIDYIESMDAEVTSEDEDEAEEFFPENAIDKESGMVFNKETGEVIDSVQAEKPDPPTAEPKEQPPEATTAQLDTPAEEPAAEEPAAAATEEKEPAFDPKAPPYQAQMIDPKTKQNWIWILEESVWVPVPKGALKVKSPTATIYDVPQEGDVKDMKGGAMQYKDCQWIILKRNEPSATPAAAPSFANAKTVEAPPIKNPAPAKGKKGKKAAPDQAEPVSDKAKQEVGDQQKKFLEDMIEKDKVDMVAWNNYVAKQDIKFPLTPEDFQNLKDDCASLIEMYKEM